MILVGRTGRGNAAGDLRPAVMRLGQCALEGDARAGDLCTHRVCKSERRGDSDSGTARAASGAAKAASGTAGDGGDNNRLTVRAIVNVDCLTGGKTYCVGDRDNDRSYGRGGS